MAEGSISETAFVRTPETNYIYDGFARGELLLQRCDACADLRFLPSHRCRACGGSATSVVTASGKGTVYSYVMTHRPELPLTRDYPVIVLVELDEGPRLVSNLMDVALPDVRIGMPVVAVFEPVAGEPGTAVARFVPARSDRA